MNEKPMRAEPGNAGRRIFRKAAGIGDDSALRAAEAV